MRINHCLRNDIYIYIYKRIHEFAILFGEVVPKDVYIHFSNLKKNCQYLTRRVPLINKYNKYI